jgi:hypothetical protein
MPSVFAEVEAGGSRVLWLQSLLKAIWPSVDNAIHKLLLESILAGKRPKSPTTMFSTAEYMRVVQVSIVCDTLCQLPNGHCCIKANDLLLVFY